MNKPQRQKAGVKSASSSMAADLVGGGFVTFETLSKTQPSLEESENVISLKKLSKRDSSTREKALRELLDRTKEDKADSVMGAFSSIVPIVDKLAFDCAPLVRLLSVRLLSRQIEILKKKSEKQLWNVLPWVFFATCDAFPPTASEALSLLSQNLPAGKSEAALKALSPRLLVAIREMIVDEKSHLLVPSKLLNNEEQDSREERIGRISEQALSLLAKIIKVGDGKEAESVLIDRMKKIAKQNHPLSRSTLQAVLSCRDPVPVLIASSSIDHLLHPLNHPSAQTGALLGPSCDALLLLLRDERFSPVTSVKNGIYNSFCSAIKRFNNLDWQVMGVRILPFFSHLCSSIDKSKRTSYISEWFSSLRENSLSSSEGVTACSDCIKFVLALLENPLNAEKEIAIQMSQWNKEKFKCRDVVEAASVSTVSDIVSSTQSLIQWIIPRLDNDTRPFLEDILQMIIAKHPPSSHLLDALLSSHDPSILFAWSFLDQKGFDLPLKLLSSADEDVVRSVNDSVDLLARLEDKGSEDLAPLYTRIAQIIPSTSSTQLRPSPLVFALLSSSDLPPSIVGRMSVAARREALHKWAREGNVDAAVRLVSLTPSNVRDQVADDLLSAKGTSALQFLSHFAFRSTLNEKFREEVGRRTLMEILSLPIEELKQIRLGDEASSAMRALDGGGVYTMIVHSLDHSHLSLQVSSYIPLSSLFFTLPEFTSPLFSHNNILNELCNIVEQLSPHLGRDAALFTFWPCKESEEKERKDGEGMGTVMGRIKKRLALAIAIYSTRSDSLPSDLLLIPVLVISQIILLSRRLSRSFIPLDEGEDQLVQLAQQITQDSSSCVNSSLVSSLFSILPPSRHPLLIYCLHPLTTVIPIGSLPSSLSTPFSALPVSGETVHFEYARQLYYSRPADKILSGITGLGKESAEQLFTLGESEERQCLSIVSFSAGCTLLLSSLPLSHNADFLLCGLITALTSCDEDKTESGEHKWEENERRTLAAHAIRFGLAAVSNPLLVGEEWDEFFLPTVRSLALKIFSELCSTEGDPLPALLSQLLVSIPSLRWGDGWHSGVFRYVEELDHANLHPSVQTAFFRTEEFLLKGDTERPDTIAAASRVLLTLSSALLDVVEESNEKEEDKVKVRVPCFLDRLALNEGWSQAAVLYACVGLVSSESLSQSGNDRAFICDALASVVNKCITFLVSKVEQFPASRTKVSIFTEEPSMDDEWYLCSWSSRLLFRVFSSFPAVVKMWYTALPKAASIFVFNFVCGGLSSTLIDNELRAVVEADLPEKFTNEQATVTVRRYSNEMLVEYIVEETRMRLALTLPTGWPLVAAVVAVEGSIVGVADGRKWLLLLTSQLYKNASVVSALSAWLRQAGKRVESADACTICMQIVAPRNKQLPKARCPTCHNKFHSSCLYKWFESSNQSTCPLCRTDFTSLP